jgi:hypothetical protein
MVTPAASPRSIRIPWASRATAANFIEREAFEVEFVAASGRKAIDTLRALRLCSNRQLLVQLGAMTREDFDSPPHAVRG